MRPAEPPHLVSGEHHPSEASQPKIRRDVRGRPLPPGPWDAEPDHVDFVHVSLPCILHRNDFHAWCGYVGVPPGHPLHGKDHDGDRDDYDNAPSATLEVHGGLTFSGSCQEGGPICHKPAPGEPDDVWWFGFDCNHCFDEAPGLRLDGLGLGGIYRDLAYVRRETERLAEQLAATAEGRS